MSPDEAAQNEADRALATRSQEQFQGPDKNTEVLGLSQWFRDKQSSTPTKQRKDATGSSSELWAGGKKNTFANFQGNFQAPSTTTGIHNTSYDGSDYVAPAIKDASLDIAEDGQTLDQQTEWTQTAFRTQYKDNAKKEWARQHNAELAQNRKAYGTSEPKPGQQSLSGTTTAPNRQVGAVTPPAYTAPRTVVPTGSVNATSAIQATSADATLDSTTPSTSSPAPTTLPGSIKPVRPPMEPLNPLTPMTPGTAKPIQNADGTVTTERSITVTDPHLNGGKPTNIPTVWGGVIVSDEEAVIRAWGSGISFPSYGSLDEATAAARQRSADLGAGKITSIGGASGVGTTPGFPEAPNIKPSEMGPTTTDKWGNRITITDPVIATDQWGNTFVASKSELEARPGGLANFTIKPYSSEETPKQPVTDAQDASTHMNAIIRGEQTKPNSYQAPSEWTQTVPDQGDSKPVEYLAQLHLRGQGQPVDRSTQESDRILQGIGGLLRGDKESSWAEAYLNDIARLAWVKENANSGTKVDPRNAPTDYIEKWKDSFYGSDNKVPFVSDLDQQMIDHAVSRTVPGKPFNWQEAFGPTGEGGLISRQVTSRDCGPNAFATFMRSRGYNADPAKTFQFAKDTGFHDGDQFTGAYNMSRMLKEEAGLDAETKPTDWKSIDAELAAGRPVGLSSGGHYWMVSAKRDGPNGPEYYTGATGAVVGNPEWARSDQIHYGGSPDYMITARGDVDPNSRAVRDMGLRPPGNQGPQRANLSIQTQAALAMNPNQDQPTLTRMSTTQTDAPTASMYRPTINKAAVRFDTDPDIIEAMLDVESSGNPDAQSSAGAGGLMQLTDSTAKGLGVTDRYDPEQSIMGGAKYFKQLQDQFGSVDLALAAYNAGPGSVMKYGGMPPYAETQSYVPKVLARLKEIKASRQSQPEMTR